MKKTPGTDGAWGLLCVAMLRNENDITLQNIEILRVSLRLQKRKETNTMELENNEEGKGKGNKKRIAIIAVVVAALIAAGIAAFLLLSPHEPEASSIKDAATTTQEQLDEEAMKSKLWISVANTIYADSATDTCYATDRDGNKITVLDNRDENSNDEAVSKTDGEVSADSEAEGSNTASATDEAGAKEETSDDIVQEETAAA